MGNFSALGFRLENRRGGLDWADCGFDEYQMLCSEPFGQMWYVICERIGFYFS
jgi:hypothetical protein